MNWKQFLLKFTKTEVSEDFNFNVPVGELLLEKFYSHFQVYLPSELLELYKQTNGIEQTITTNGERIVTGDLIWPLEYTIQQNINMRTHAAFANLYMPFDPLLFFADAGNGDLFAFAILNKRIRNRDIFVWNHENDSRTWVAPSLDQFVEWWLQGKIKI
jgi:hypothetical protein